MSKTAGETLFLGVLIGSVLEEISMHTGKLSKNICPHQCEVTSLLCWRSKYDKMAEERLIHYLFVSWSFFFYRRSGFWTPGCTPAVPFPFFILRSLASATSFPGSLSLLLTAYIPYFTITTCANSHNKSPLKYLYCFIGSVVLEDLSKV